MRTSSRSTVVVLLLLFAVVAASGPRFADAQSDDAQSGNRAEVLVLGSWHMANLLDESHDVLQPRRQEEMAAVMAALKAFRPTRIALEASFYRADDMRRRYAAYREGGEALTRNERQQIGFRLAAELGHDTVYSIDADGDFPLLAVQDYVEANDRMDEYRAYQALRREEAEAFDTYLAEHSILDTLLYVNNDDFVDALMAHDFRLARFAEHWNWPGPDLVADYFRRNMRIYGNVAPLAAGPGDRVLVIIGFGHLPWLWHAFEADPVVRLRKLPEFAAR